MADHLYEILYLIRRLALEGVDVVCCGGAARDTWFGRIPKDYDFVILAHPPNVELTGLIHSVTGKPCYELGGANQAEHDPEGYESAQERGLDKVYESCLIGADNAYTLQFLLYSPERTASFNGDPYTVVETFDCDLNRIWFAEVNGRLIPRPHGDFPCPRTGNRNSFSPGVDENRREYMRQKFPEFNHQ